jgi:hypothetical protein
VFEVIQPDLEINRRHTAALPIPPTDSSVRAASGSSVEGFGQILAAALPRNAQSARRDRQFTCYSKVKALPRGRR